MKSIIVFVILVLAIITGIATGRGYLMSQDSTPLLLPVSTESPIPAQLLESAQVAQPLKVSIPKIGVSASIEPVGQDSQGRMDVPKKAADVGWYNLGAKPGEIGSAVFAGHLDDVSGRPAVFWDLKTLENGDEIIVTDQAGKQYTFVVVDRKTYPFDQFPLEKVFNTNDKPRLNLITCEGTWDPNNRIYSDRGVVFAELVSK